MMNKDKRNLNFDDLFSMSLTKQSEQKKENDEVEVFQGLKNFVINSIEKLKESKEYSGFTSDLLFLRDKVDELDDRNKNMTESLFKYKLISMLGILITCANTCFQIIFSSGGLVPLLIAFFACGLSIFSLINIVRVTKEIKENNIEKEKLNDKFKDLDFSLLDKEVVEKFLDLNAQESSKLNKLWNKELIHIKKDLEEYTQESIIEKFIFLDKSLSFFKKRKKEIQ